MIDVCRVVLAALLVAPIAIAAQSSQPGQPSAAGTQQSPIPAAKRVPGTVECPTPPAPATLPVRSFNAPTGMLVIPVLSSRVEDFEKFLGYVRDGLAKTTDVGLREQAKSLRFTKLAEPGPNGDVLYVLIADPAVTCVDYGFQPILIASIPDQKELDDVWKLYQNSVRNGGYLMNLVPVN